MLKCLNSLVSITSSLQEFVFLVFRRLKDKVIQRSLRLYIKNVAANEDHESIINLTGKLLALEQRSSFILEGNEFHQNRK